MCSVIGQHEKSSTMERLYYYEVSFAYGFSSVHLENRFPTVRIQPNEHTATYRQLTKNLFSFANNSIFQFICIFVEAAGVSRWSERRCKTN